MSFKTSLVQTVTIGAGARAVFTHRKVANVNVGEVNIPNLDVNIRIKNTGGSGSLYFKFDGQATTSDSLLASSPTLVTDLEVRSSNYISVLNNGSASTVITVEYGTLIPLMADSDVELMVYDLALDALGRFNVRKFGATGNGITNDTNAINAAIIAANAQPYGGEVYMPPGKYKILQTGLFGAVRPKSNVVLRGAGMGRTILECDDSANTGTDMLGNNISNGATFDPLSNFSLLDLTLRGRADVERTTGSQLMRIKGDNILIDRVESQYSRNMGMVLVQCNNVTVRNCKVYRCIADGIAAWDCGETLITGNEITGANDDAISAHSGDATPAPVRSGVTITHNQITESQGIAVLGAKAVVIGHNILRRIMCSGIRVVAPGTSVQGQTSQFALKITNNIVEDVFKRNEPSPRNAYNVYIRVGGGIRRAGGAGAPPGEVDNATGTGVSLFGGDTIGTLYLNETATAPASAGRLIDISNNTLIRTLPAVTAVSNWGFPESTGGIWVGNNGDGSGFFNGAIPEANLATDGIHLDPALWDCSIKNNLIMTTGLYGIFFASNETVVSRDFMGVVIEGNQIVRYTHSGIRFPTVGTTVQRVTINANHFDADPDVSHANRKTGPRDGSWTVSGQPWGIYAQITHGVTVTNNHFRNLNTILEDAGSGNYGYIAGNVIYCDPVFTGFSTGNKGIGTPQSHYSMYVCMIEECDPTNAAFGQQKSKVHGAYPNAPPTVGTYAKGHVIWNSSPDPTEASGWMRGTTGSGTVVGTDWHKISTLP